MCICPRTQVWNIHGKQEENQELARVGKGACKGMKSCGVTTQRYNRCEGLAPSPAQEAVGEGIKDLREEEEGAEAVIIPNAKELRSTSMMSPSRRSQTQPEEPVRDFPSTKGFGDLGVEARSERDMTLVLHSRWQLSSKSQLRPRRQSGR